MAKQIPDSPEVVLRRELRKKQNGIVNEWNRLNEKIAKEEALLSNYPDQNVTWAQTCSNSELMRFYVLDGFTEWPKHCVWYGTGSGPCKGSSGFKKSSLQKKTFLVESTKGIKFGLLTFAFVFALMWVLYTVLAIDFNAQSQFVKWIQIGIFWAVPLGWKFVIVPGIISGKFELMDPIICSGKPMELDVYCNKHRRLANTTSKEDIDAFYVPPIVKPNVSRIRKIYVDSVVSRNRESKERIKEELKNLRKGVLNAEKRLADVRDSLSDVESSLRRKKLPENTRLAIMAKSDYKCVLCGIDLTLVKPHIDHIIPIAKGGTDSQDNWQAVCQKCNLKKGKKIL